MNNVIDLLQERGLIESTTSKELSQLTMRPLTVYCGFDPTAESLHLGHLIPILALAWFQRLGHTPVAVVGGATGMIGDPSGKKHERKLLDARTIEHNVKGVAANLKQILDFGSQENSALVLNNYDWFKEFFLIEFLRDVGKWFRLGTMLGKESVRTRLSSEEGISFTEFSYPLFQGYDFLHLYDNHGVTVQLGGSDQWGNITAGVELVRKLRGKTVYGVTFPLLTTSTGQKFGKTEKGAVWLSPDKHSPYEFYQYLFRTSDADVIKLMRLLTFMDMEEIQRYEKEMGQADYKQNSAQKRLAEEVTRLVHGEERMREALKVTIGAAPGKETVLDSESLEALAGQMPTFDLPLTTVLNAPLIQVVVTVGLKASKGEVRRLIRNGGVYLNNEKINDENTCITEKDLIGDRLLLLAVGKKNKILIRCF